MPDGGTVNGDANGPRASALNAVVQSATPQLKGCMDRTSALPTGRDLQISVHYSILPSGQPSDVQISGAVPASALSCMEAVMRGLKFPEFGGPPVENTFPFSYRRDIR